MLLFILVVFVLSILLYQPQKKSLKDNSSYSLFQKLLKNKATLGLGIIILLCAMISFMPNHQINKAIGIIFGMSRFAVLKWHLVYQPISNIFFHFNDIHLIGNLSTLLFLSAYERRVGSLRFISIFLLSGILASILYLSIMPMGEVTMGASGGISGIAAAYFTDYPQVSKKEWIYAALTVIAFIFIMSILPDNSIKQAHVHVNWIDHLLGGIIALLYVRAFPIPISIFKN